MDDGYLGTIRLFAGMFAPRNWAYCQGQLLSIAEYSALYSLLGTQFGGDGRTSFGLPDLRGRVPLGTGTGPGLSPRYQGQWMGYETTTMTVTNMPVHTHNLSVNVSIPASAEEGNVETPVGNSMAVVEEGTPYHTGSGEDAMANPAVSASMDPVGGGQPVNNMQPSLALNYIICLVGLYPSRS